MSRLVQAHTRLLVTCGLVLCAGAASAQSTTSPQGGTAIYNGAAVCVSSSSGIMTQGGLLASPCTDSSGNGKWFTVEVASLKTSTNKTLFVSPALVTGLYTNTLVVGGSGSTETATAVGSVGVRVLLDCTNCATAGQPQGPAANFAMAGQPDKGGSGIVYDARIQQLTGALGNAITNSCLTPTGNTCTQEQMDLILSTTSAHTFDFILPQVGAGTHSVTIQARLDTGNVCYNDNGTYTSCSTTDVVNSAEASSVSAALFGLGSETVMPVQLAPGFSF
jgi:hypothetical protein